MKYYLFINKKRLINETEIDKNNNSQILKIKSN